MRYILLMILIGICGCKGPIRKKETAAQQEKNTMAKMRLTDLNDRPIDLGQYKGRTLFINFWATWCKPCILEMPSIKNAEQLLHKNEILFLLASSESAEQIREFKKDHDYPFTYARLVNMEEMNLDVLPTTYIFNPKGELVFSEVGYRKWDDTNNIKMIVNINNQK